MRRRLAELLSSVAASLLDAAHRLDPETVQIVEEVEPEPERPPCEPGTVAPTRELAIGLTMRAAGPGAWLVLHDVSCPGVEGCTCRPTAIRSQAGRA